MVHTRHHHCRHHSEQTVSQLVGDAYRRRIAEPSPIDAPVTKLYEQDNEQLRKELKEQKEQYDGLLIASDAERAA
jgi:hypothetical protein